MSSTRQNNCGWKYPDRSGIGIGQGTRWLNNSEGEREHQKTGNLDPTGMHVR